MKSFKSFNTSNTTAYKGYLITKQLVGNIYNISKNGHHIGSAPTVEAAKKEIDNLV